MSTEPEGPGPEPNKYVALLSPIEKGTMWAAVVNDAGNDLPGTAHQISVKNKSWDF